jgi:hypothetical protein
LSLPYNPITSPLGKIGTLSWISIELSQYVGQGCRITRAEATSAFTVVPNDLP